MNISKRQQEGRMADRLSGSQMKPTDRQADRRQAGRQASIFVLSIGTDRCDKEHFRSPPCPASAREERSSAGERITDTTSRSCCSRDSIQPNTLDVSWDILQECRPATSKCRGTLALHCTWLSRYFHHIRKMSLIPIARVINL